jgi:sortase A
MRVLRLAGMALLFVGGVLAGHAVYLHAKAELAGALIRRAWEAETVQGETVRPWPWADTHPVARLRVPRLGYDEIVLEGATLRTLAFGPARLRSGADFGEPGNVVMAGHRTNWFRPLEGIATGDEIEVQWRDARAGGIRSRRYEVEAIRVIKPEDTSWLAPTTEDALTLVTCYPFGSGPRSPQRFIVRARPQGPSRWIDTRSANRSTGMLSSVLYLR